jgi:hypothetical protein
MVNIPNHILNKIAKFFIIQLGHSNKKDVFLYGCYREEAIKKSKDDIYV